MKNRTMFGAGLALALMIPVAAFAQGSAAPSSSGFVAFLAGILQPLVTPAAIGYAVTIAAALVPKSTAPGLWSFVRGVIDLIGANWGNAANAANAK